MATWQDGPAYAPKERPRGFAPPLSAVSLEPPARPRAPAPEPTPAPSPPPPGLPPAFAAPPSGPTDLAALARPPERSRDPRQAFAVVTTSLTPAGSAWGSLHTSAPQIAPATLSAWTVDQPWQSGYAPAVATGQFPAPGTPQWFTAGSAEPVARVTAPVNAKSLLESTGLPFIALLAIGVMLAPLSFFCLALAFGAVMLVRYRRRATRWVIAGAWAFAGLLYLFGQLAGFFYTFDLTLQVGCLIALAGGVVMQFLALRAGDRPERTH